MLELGPALEVSSSHEAGGAFVFDDETASRAAGGYMSGNPGSELAATHQPSVAEEAAFEFDEEGNVTFRDEEDLPPAVEQDASGEPVAKDQDNDFKLSLGTDQIQTGNTVSPYPLQGRHTINQHSNFLSRHMMRTRYTLAATTSHQSDRTIYHKHPQHFPQQTMNMCRGQSKRMWQSKKILKK